MLLSYSFWGLGVFWSQPQVTPRGPAVVGHCPPILFHAILYKLLFSLWENN